MNDDSSNGALLEEGRIYQAKVIDQILAKNHNDEPQLALGIRIVALLRNDKNPGDGTVECPQVEREVRINFVADDPDRLRMAVRDMERLGFVDDDISRLHPEHPQFFSLIDKEIHVRMKVINDAEYWNLAWIREKPKPLAMEDGKKVADALKDKIAAARKRMREDRGAKKTAAAASNNPAPPPDVGY